MGKQGVKVSGAGRAERSPIQRERERKLKFGFLFFFFYFPLKLQKSHATQRCQLAAYYIIYKTIYYLYSVANISSIL